MPLVLVTFGMHVVAPLAMIAWLARRRPTGRIDAALQVVLTDAFVAVMVFIGPGWCWFGTWIRWLLCILAAVASVRALLRARGLPWMQLSAKQISSGLVRVVAAGLLLSTLPAAATAGRHDAAIALEFPLNDGTYLITHGGSNPVMNVHQNVKAQSFALDIVRLGTGGMRAAGLMPSDVSRYAIFGTPVHAPCDGEVLRAEDGHEDGTPPNPDRNSLVGNNVVIHCLESSVLLAHLQRSSVLVRTEERVSRGQVVGRVGNTGNTSEPHLHISAVRGRHDDVTVLATTGEPVPMTFDGRFLVRNDRVVR